MMRGMGNMMGAMSWFGWLFSALVVVLIVWLVMNIMRQRTEDTNLGATNSSTNSNDALERAKQRYAQGEIDRKTFLQIKEDIAQR